VRAASTRRYFHRALELAIAARLGSDRLAGGGPRSAVVGRGTFLPPSSRWVNVTGDGGGDPADRESSEDEEGVSKGAPVPNVDMERDDERPDDGYGRAENPVVPEFTGWLLLRDRLLCHAPKYPPPANVRGRLGFARQPAFEVSSPRATRPELA
jgi:hypothetical protein